MKTLQSLGGPPGKRGLLRAEFNRPPRRPTIPDGRRIRAAPPTLNALREAGAKVLVTAHLGRPKGEGYEEKFSLRPVAARLGELLGAQVPLADDVVDESARAVAADLAEGQVALVENVRFDARGTSKVDAEREDLARQLADLADVFVSDGFGAGRRKEAVVYDGAKLLPSAGGKLVEKEIAALSRATTDPARPYVVVLGGSKVSDKLGVIENLLGKANTLCIGGGMVFTFLAAQGYEVGNSLLEEDQLDTVKGYLETAKREGVEIVLPTDILVAPKFAADSPATAVPAAQMPADQIGLDIGPDSAQTFRETIAAGNTVVWNGPMGVFEFPAFAEGTKAVAQGLIDSTGRGGFTIVGGGDSAAAVRLLGFDEDSFGHISTGGGASLEYLEGKVLPGIDVLS